MNILTPGRALDATHMPKVTDRGALNWNARDLNMRARQSKAGRAPGRTVLRDRSVQHAEALAAVDQSLMRPPPVVRRTSPACAGNTQSVQPSGIGDGDHPRVRGGPQPARWVGLDVPGATPACAGTTPHVVGALRPSRGHPRVRGDHAGSPSPTPQDLGPPPRARGPPGPSRRRPTWPRGHPRVRGDHCEMHAAWLLAAGPPPRARGPPRRGAARSGPPGATPACAGTTASRASSRRAERGHPRVRGDH